MKIFIQPTQDSPEDFIQADSKDWDSFIRIRPFAISVQGVTFSADWYCVVDQPYGCDVITLDDDPRWYPNPIANVWHFRHIAPDSNGAWNTNQTRIIYADNYTALVPANTLLKPFRKFKIPCDFLEGLMVFDALCAEHIACQNIKGWREWTQGVPAEETDEIGCIRDQTTLGRYLKPDGTRTYIVRSQATTVGFHTVVHESGLTPVLATPATLTSSALDPGIDEQTFYFVTVLFEPDSAAWPTGIYRFQFDVAAAGGQIRYGLLDQGGSSGHFDRTDEFVNIDFETKQQIEAAQSGTGLKLVTTGSVSWTAGDATDAFGCLVSVINIAEHGIAQSVTINLNQPDSFADGPWPAAAGGAGILMPKLQSKKFRHILTR